MKLKVGQWWGKYRYSRGPSTWIVGKFAFLFQIKPCQKAEGALFSRRKGFQQFLAGNRLAVISEHLVIRPINRNQ